MPSSTRQAVNGTHERQITLVKDSPPLAPAPRFAACLGAPGGWLCVRLIRCTNAAPIAHDGQVSQVVAAQCVCAVASQLGSTARSGVVRGDSSGGAEWDETLRLPLPLGSVALDVELRLSVRDAAQRSQCAPMALLPRTGKATVPLHGASGRCWCAVRGSGPPRSDGEPAGRIEMTLFAKVYPKTAENFRALCTGEKGFGYAGTSFYKVLQGLAVQGGDVSGKGEGRSIYGEPFAHDNYSIMHNKAGIISMVNSGVGGSSGTSDSRFLIQPNDDSGFLDGRYEAFGRVTSGLGVVQRLNDVVKVRLGPSKWISEKEPPLNLVFAGARSVCAPLLSSTCFACSLASTV